MNILFIEPFFGGSHRAFAEGLIAHSCHTFDLLTLPDRNWDWRMRGAAVHMAKAIESRFREGKCYDGILISNMLRLSDLKALTGERLPPVIVYFHESQLTYPTPTGSKRDRGLVMSDITTALSADRVLFNSSYHLSAFMSALSEWLGDVPDYPLPWVMDDIESKSSVLYPGIDFPDMPELRPWSRDKALIIWNHRWSYDKNARSFFYALDRMRQDGLDFDLALLGECPGWIPEEYKDAEKRFESSLIQFGYLDNKQDYISFLESGSIAVSTAKQENFGMSMVEAMRYGCLPLLPNRLSYPEILPEPFYDTFLYSSQKDFLKKLAHLITSWKDMIHIRNDLAGEMDRFSWKNLVDRFDQMFNRVFKLTGEPEHPEF